MRHRVYLVRHAKAEPHADGGDVARRLTAEGRSRFTKLLGRLRGRLSVVRVLTSPLARARETAEILAHATGARVEEDERLAAGRSNARDLVELARTASPGTALVGHNPEIAEALARLADEHVEVKPGAVAALDVEGKKVSLAWVEAPAKE